MPFKVKTNLHPSPAFRIAKFSTDAPAVDELIHVLSNLWNVDHTSIDVTYIDADGDLISIVTEEDRQDWLKTLPAGATSLPKLTIVPRPPLSQNPTLHEEPRTLTLNPAEERDELSDGFEAIEVVSDGDDDDAEDATPAVEREQDTIIVKQREEVAEDDDTAAHEAVQDEVSSNATTIPNVNTETNNNPAQDIADQITDTVNNVVGGVLGAIASKLSQIPGAQGFQGGPSAPRHHNHPHVPPFPHHHRPQPHGHHGPHPHPPPPPHGPGARAPPASGVPPPPPPPPFGGIPSLSTPFFELDGRGFTMGNMHIPFPNVDPRLFGSNFGQPRGSNPTQNFDWESMRENLTNAAANWASQAEDIRAQAETFRQTFREATGRGRDAFGFGRGGSRGHHHHAQPHDGGRGGGRSAGAHPHASQWPHGARAHGCGRHRHHHHHHRDEPSEEDDETKTLTDLEAAMEQVMRDDAQTAGTSAQAPRHEKEEAGKGRKSRRRRRKHDRDVSSSSSSSTSSSSSSSSSDEEDDHCRSKRRCHKHRHHRRPREPEDDSASFPRHCHRMHGPPHLRRGPSAGPAPFIPTRCPAPPPSPPPADVNMDTESLPELEPTEMADLDPSYRLPSWAERARDGTRVAQSALHTGWSYDHPPPERPRTRFVVEEMGPDRMSAFYARGGGRGRGRGRGRGGFLHQGTFYFGSAGVPTPPANPSADNQTEPATATTSAPEPSTNKPTTTLKASPYLPRTWLDSSGKHRVRGSFIPSRSARDRGRVKLLIIKKPAGEAAQEGPGNADEARMYPTKVVEIRLNQLCMEDRIWVEREQERLDKVRREEKAGTSSGTTSSTAPVAAAEAAPEAGVEATPVENNEQDRERSDKSKGKQKAAEEDNGDDSQGYIIE